MFFYVTYLMLYQQWHQFHPYTSTMTHLYQKQHLHFKSALLLSCVSNMDTGNLNLIRVKLSYLPGLLISFFLVKPFFKFFSTLKFAKIFRMLFILYKSDRLVEFLIKFCKRTFSETIILPIFQRKDPSNKIFWPVPGTYLGVRARFLASGEACLGLMIFPSGFET